MINEVQRSIFLGFESQNLRVIFYVLRLFKQTCSPHVSSFISTFSSVSHDRRMSEVKAGYSDYTIYSHDPAKRNIVYENGPAY